MTVEQVGSGRRHGEEPPAGGPERTLYDATHWDTAWQQPDPADVAALIRWYRTLPGCSTGGSLHIVLDDYNCDDRHVQWCDGYASGQGDTCGSELAGLLLRMDVYDRVHAVEMANAIPAVTYDRAVLVNVIVYHYRKDIEGCGCGWAELGRSHAEHVADVYEQSVLADA